MDWAGPPGGLDNLFAQYDHIVSYGNHQHNQAEAAPTDAPPWTPDAEPDTSQFNENAVDFDVYRHYAEHAMQPQASETTDSAPPALGMLGGKIGAAVGAAGAIAGTARYMAPEVAEGLAEGVGVGRIASLAEPLLGHGMRTFAATEMGELSGAAAGARLGEGFGVPGMIAGGILGAAMVTSQAGQQARNYLQASRSNGVLARHQIVAKPKVKPYSKGWFGNGPW